MMIVDMMIVVGETGKEKEVITRKRRSDVFCFIHGWVLLWDRYDRNDRYDDRRGEDR